MTALGDSSAVSSHSAAEELVRRSRDTHFMLWSTCLMCCRGRSSQFAIHVVRDLNKRADGLATDAILSGSVLLKFVLLLNVLRFVCVSFLMGGSENPVAVVIGLVLLRTPCLMAFRSLKKLWLSFNVWWNVRKCCGFLLG